jgi:hypothetical protein
MRVVIFLAISFLSLFSILQPVLADHLEHENARSVFKLASQTRGLNTNHAIPQVTHESAEGEIAGFAREQGSTDHLQARCVPCESPANPRLCCPTGIRCCSTKCCGLGTFCCREKVESYPRLDDSMLTWASVNSGVLSDGNYVLP